VQQTSLNSNCPIKSCSCQPGDTYCSGASFPPFSTVSEAVGSSHWNAICNKRFWIALANRIHNLYRTLPFLVSVPGLLFAFNHDRRPQLGSSFSQDMKFQSNDVSEVLVLWEGSFVPSLPCC
jgi:hypothetical protein